MMTVIFQDTYQMMPKEGFTKMFEKILDNPKFDFENLKIYFENEVFEGKAIYTG